MGSQAGRIVLDAGGTIVLARLLAPRDFGLVAMVLSVTSFVTIFRDLGLASATVQSRSLDHTRVTSLFWLNTGFGVAMAALTALLAPLIARFFGEPRLGGIALVIAGVLVIEGLAIQHQALLRRRMRFGSLAWLEVLSVAAGVSVGITLAWWGAGYWSLVWMRVAQSATRAIVAWTFCDWRPGLGIGFGAVRPQVAFGTRLTVSRFARHTSRNLDRVLVGRVLSAEALGLYAKAAGWLVAPFQQLSWPIARVAVPVLSRLQDDPLRFRSYFVAGQSALAAAGVPAAAFLVVDAHHVIPMLLGPQWLDAIPIFRALAPVAVASLVQMGFHWCYVSLGNTRRQMRWEVASAAILVVAFALGLRGGAVGVAAAYGIVSILLLPPGALVCFRQTPISPFDMLGVFVRPVVAACAASGALALLLRGDLGSAALVHVLVHLMFFTIVYAGTWLALPGGRTALGRLVALRGELQRSKRTPP
jgi:O-antigen/teichoic acid export membrane protein